MTFRICVHLHIKAVLSWSYPISSQQITRLVQRVKQEYIAIVLFNQTFLVVFERGHIPIKPIWDIFAFSSPNQAAYWMWHKTLLFYIK